MSAFVASLEMNDTAVRFKFDRSDPELHEMSESMNRIIALYTGSRKDLETRKLYYDRILRVMTHEMRNAITPIVALSSDLSSNPDNYSDSEKAEVISLINTQSNDIKKFLDSYHTLTHLPAPEKSIVESSSFVDRLRTSIIPSIAKEAGVEGDIISFTIAQESKIFIDENLFTRLLHNLIKNSFEAVKMKDDPKITISFTNTSFGSAITITDNGTGIPKTIMDNQFQPFMTTKPGGSGIGMFLSRQIARLHGGEMKIKNTSEKGTTISITLPGINS